MKKSLVLLLIMVGLVGGMFIIGCGGGEKPGTGQTMQGTQEKTGETGQAPAEMGAATKEEAQ